MASIGNKNVAGEILVEVKAKLSLDRKTFDTCLNLIRMKLEEDGYAGIIITVPKDGCVGPNRVDLIKTLDGADKAICGLYTSDEERMATNEPYDKN